MLTLSRLISFPQVENCSKLPHTSRAIETSNKLPILHSRASAKLAFDAAKILYIMSMKYAGDDMSLQESIDELCHY